MEICICLCKSRKFYNVSLKMESFSAARSSLRDSISMNAKSLNLLRDIKELFLEKLKNLDVRLEEIFKKGQVLNV